MIAPFRENSPFTVKKDFDLSVMDIRMLTLCYLPFLGPDAFSLYFSLYANEGFGQNGSLRFGKDLFLSTGLTPGKLQTGRTRLEACGLLKTLVRLDPDSPLDNGFLFLLKAPCSPRSFFANGALKGLLETALSPAVVQKLKAQFRLPRIPEDGFSDLSASFLAVYGKPQGGDGEGEIDLGLPVSSADGYDETKLTEKALSHALSRISDLGISVLGEKSESVLEMGRLYGLDADSLAKDVAKATDSQGLFSYSAFEEMVRDDAKYLSAESALEGSFDTLAQAENQAISDAQAMDQTSTGAFLAGLLKTPKVPPSIMGIAKSLRADYGFRQGVVNAMFAYVYRRLGQIPGVSYFDKIADGLFAQKPQNATEAMTAMTAQGNDILAKMAKKSGINLMREGQRKLLAAQQQEKKGDYEADDQPTPEEEKALLKIFGGD